MQGCLYGARSGKKDRTTANSLPASVDVAPHTSAYDFNCNSLLYMCLNLQRLLLSVLDGFL